MNFLKNKMYPSWPKKKQNLNNSISDQEIEFVTKSFPRESPRPRWFHWWTLLHFPGQNSTVVLQKLEKGNTADLTLSGQQETNNKALWKNPHLRKKIIDHYSSRREMAKILRKISSNQIQQCKEEKRKNSTSRLSGIYFRNVRLV